MIDEEEVVGVLDSIVVALANEAVDAAVAVVAGPAMGEIDGAVVDAVVEILDCVMVNESAAEVVR
jgi:large-conductance mechanosensitive channel